MRGEVGVEEERQRDAESWSEGGGEWVVFMVQHTNSSAWMGPVTESYVSEISLDRRAGGREGSSDGRTMRAAGGGRGRRSHYIV